MTAAASRYDVFLSHNSQDKPLVAQLAGRLVAEAKVRPFLDEWHLFPGEEWLPKLEAALRDCATVAVFFGPTGNGPWHEVEMQVALMRAVREKQEFRLIPVVLPEADAGAIPDFLQLRTWVDFRDGIASEIAFKRLVAGIRGQAMHFEGIELPDEPAPYRGLLHFEAEHARFFFGREQEIGPTEDKPNLVDKLRVHRFVAVVGSSGSGKSSTVRAGLLPRLDADVIPGSRQWQTITFAPGRDPYRSLANELVRELPAAERGPAVRDLLAQFEERDVGLRNTLETWFADTSAPLLLFIDQFEELFTHAPNARTDAAARRRYDERIGRFIRQLADEVQRPDGRFRAVITLRADFIPHCLRVTDLKNLLQERQMLLGELATDDQALREIIQRPAHEVGAMLETGLMEVLLADVHSQTGALPLLEHALSELWRARRGPWLTLDAYKTSGGVGGALRKRAQETLQRLTGPQQQIARRIFVKLTSLEEDTEDARRRVDRQSLYAAATDAAEIDAVIDVLAGPEARLIVADEHSLSIAHETLIRNWPQLRTWLDEDRQLERIHRELERAANDWEANGRSKRHLFHGTSAKLAETEEHATALADRITPLESEFLTACRQERDAETRRLRRRVWLTSGIAGVAVFLLIISMIAGCVAWNARIASERARNELEDALVQSFYRTILMDNRYGPPNSNVREALWELAILSADNVAVRERLLEKWFDSGESFKRIQSSDRWLQSDIVLRTVGDLEPAIAQQIAHHIVRFNDTLLTAMVMETDSSRFRGLARALVALPDRVEPDVATALAHTTSDAMLEAAKAEKNAVRLDALSEALAALADRLEPANVAAISASVSMRLLEVMGNEKEAASQQRRLSDALATHLALLEPIVAQEYASKAIIQSLFLMQDERDTFELGNLCLAVARLATWLEPGVAAEDAASASQRALDVFEKGSGNSFTVESILRGLAALPAHLKPTEAERIGGRLLTVIENPRNDFSLRGLSQALAALAARLEPENGVEFAATASIRLLEVMANEENAWRLGNLSLTLIALTRGLEPTRAAAHAATASDRLLKIMENETDPAQLSFLSEALAELAPALEAAKSAKQAERASDRLLGSMENGTDTSGLSNLGRGVAVLTGALKPAEAAKYAARASNRLLEAMEAETNTSQLENLSHALAALTGRLEPAETAANVVRATDRLIRKMENGMNTDQLRKLSIALAEVLAHLEPEAPRLRLYTMSNFLLYPIGAPPSEGEHEARDRELFQALLKPLNKDDLVEVLKWPFCVGEAEKLVLEALEVKLSADENVRRKVKGPISFGGDVRKFVAQAESLGIKNHKTPAVRPRLEDARKELVAILKSGAAGSKGN